jgi:hypothetical protein
MREQVVEAVLLTIQVQIVKILLRLQQGKI